MSCVYVFGEPGGDRVKIGHSRSLAARRRNLRCQYRMRRGEVLFQLPCKLGRHVEGLTHGMLTDKRIEGEWFAVSLDEAVEAIRTAADVFARVEARA